MFAGASIGPLSEKPPWRSAIETLEPFIGSRVPLRH
jgi:hypothetical protein